MEIICDGAPGTDTSRNPEGVGCLDAPGQIRPGIPRGWGVWTPRCTVEELMRTALLFVIVVAMVATGLWLFVAGLFFESETDIWYVVSGGWLIGLGGDRLWRDFVAPFLGFEEV